MQALRELSRVRGHKFWQITPKVHMIMHLSSFPGKLNPRFVQNYQEESLIGTTARIWARSAQGRYRRTIQKTVLIKKMVALMVRLERDL